MSRRGSRERQNALKLLLVAQKEDKHFQNLIDNCTQMGISEFVLFERAKKGKNGDTGHVDDEMKSSVERCERVQEPLLTRSNKGVVDYIKEAPDQSKRCYFVVVDTRYPAEERGELVRSFVEELHDLDGVIRGEVDDEKQNNILSNFPFFKGSPSSIDADVSASVSTSRKKMGVQVYLVIGPEGGWDADVVNDLLVLGDNKHIIVRPVTLGEGVLRPDTAVAEDVACTTAGWALKGT